MIKKVMLACILLLYFDNATFAAEKKDVQKSEYDRVKQFLSKNSPSILCILIVLYYIFTENKEENNQNHGTRHFLRNT